MYLHAKNNHFRHYLRQKACIIDADEDVDFSKLTDVFEIFNYKKMHSMLKEHERKSNLYRNHQRYLDYLGETAGFLPVATLPTDIVEKLNDLCIAFPNFSSVIDFYREQFALSRLSGSNAFLANPLLITGPPGVGKTAFCYALAKIVSTHFELISMSGMTAGFVIGGMSSNWADGKPGRVVEALARGLYANPLIAVDEIDKVAGDHRYDPLGALYQLLEKETSAKFVDEGLEVPANCSHIVWVGTANKTDHIAEPILSRFTLMEVNKPTPDEMHNVLRSIYRKVIRTHDWGEKFTADLPLDVSSKLIESGMEPRLIQRELISACGKAALRAPDDNLSYAIAPDDINAQVSDKRKSSVFQSIFPIASVLEEPEETIHFWSIREVTFGEATERTQHLVGYIDRQGLGRVSSAIKTFDREKMRIQTRSGRIYSLHDQPGHSADAEYVWAHWKKLNAVIEEVNVTHHYCAVH